MNWDTIENRWRQFQDVLMDLEFADDDEVCCTNRDHLDRVAMLQERVFREASFFGADDGEFTVETEELNSTRGKEEGRFQDDGSASQIDDANDSQLIAPRSPS